MLEIPPVDAALPFRSALTRPIQNVNDALGRPLCAFNTDGTITGDLRGALAHLQSLPEVFQGYGEAALCAIALTYAIRAEDLAGGRHGNVVAAFRGAPPHSPAFGVYRNIAPPEHYALTRGAAERWAQDAAEADRHSHFTVIQALSVHRDGQAQELQA